MWQDSQSAFGSEKNQYFWEALYPSPMGEKVKIVYIYFNVLYLLVLDPSVFFLGNFFVFIVLCSWLSLGPGL